MLFLLAIPGVVIIGVLLALCSASNRFEEEKKMLLLNIEYIPGKKIEALASPRAAWSSPRTSARTLWRA